MYVNGKTRPAETIPEMGGRRMMEEVNSTMIYCNKIYKCHSVSPGKQ
jgi:hypothetical protein